MWTIILSFASTITGEPTTLSDASSRDTTGFMSAFGTTMFEPDTTSSFSMPVTDMVTGSAEMEIYKITKI